MSALQFLKSYWKSAFTGVFIFALCIIPAKQLKKIDPLINYEDLAAHLIMFIAFSGLIYHDLKKQPVKPKNPKNIVTAVFIYGILLASITELSQLIFASLNRSASITDFLFDLGGILVGVSLMKLIMR
jgi:VanZ family protein